MSRRRIKNKVLRCTKCGETVPCLKLVTLPALRKRTEEEQEAYELRKKHGIPLTKKEALAELRDRKVRLCNKCVVEAIREMEKQKKEIEEYVKNHHPKNKGEN